MTAKRSHLEWSQPSGRELLRAADHDRQLVVDRLKLALDEGRLTLPEYDERVQQVYTARTYADLNALLADLPAADGGQVRLVDLPAGRPVRRERAIPLALMVLWTVWGGVTALNVVLWLLLEITVGSIYPWPLWVGAPTGAALLATTVGVQAIRRNRSAGDGA